MQFFKRRWKIKEKTYFLKKSWGCLLSRKNMHSVEIYTQKCILCKTKFVDSLPKRVFFMDTLHRTILRLNLSTFSWNTLFDKTSLAIGRAKQNPYQCRYKAVISPFWDCHCKNFLSWECPRPYRPFLETHTQIRFLKTQKL